MQCPETPQPSTRHAPASKTYSTSDSNLSKRDADLCGLVHKISPGGALTSSTDNPSQKSVEAKAVAGIGRRRLAKTTIRSRNFSKPLKKSQRLDDVFEAQSKSSAAALQFHAAARRLALSPLSQSLQNKSVSSHAQDAHQHRLHDSLHAAPSAPRSDSSPHIHRSSQRSFIECDITSARKDLTSMRSSPHSNPACFASVSRSFSYGSPIPFDPTKGQGRRSKISRNPRNFSRPIPNLKPPHATNSLKTQARNFSRPTYHLGPVRLSGPNSCIPTKLNSGTDVSTSFTTSPGADPSDYAPHLPSTENDHEASITAASDAKDQEQFACAVENETEQPRGLLCDSQSAHNSNRESFESAVSEGLGDKRLQLSNWEIWLQRVVFAFFIFAANIGLGLAYLGSFKHPYMLPILVFMKSKDILSTAVNLSGLLRNFFHHLIWPPKKPKSRWILSLVCAYAETEEQILKTVFSLARANTHPHKQVICIILDGKPRDILSKMSAVNITVQRPYTTWRGNRGEITVNAGHLEGIPLIVVAKTKNAGKKDSLILGHDLFNYPRKDMPQSTHLLRKEIWQIVLPIVVQQGNGGFETFDFIFCTDADSTIHGQALRRLADTLCRENNAIAACGVLFAEFSDKKTEYSPWHLFQQFQYTFGQYVRRQAESMWGRVTCLPGCITMIVVRPETGQAISEYAKPVTEHNLFRHQVQYLGTDRRLTWCMMSQGKHLRTVFVPDAISETVVPDGVSHYLSQRRRWASNAYFNDFFYLFGPNQRLVTRLFATIDIVRLSLVYYRVFNTAYFVHGLITHFYLVKIIPTLVVTKTPATWYLLLVLIREPLLRKRLHKILLGMCINQIISPILSVVVFTNVIFHMGSQAWGKTGASTQGPSSGSAPTQLATTDTPQQGWTPRRLANSVRAAIHGATLNPREEGPYQPALSVIQHDSVKTLGYHGPRSSAPGSPLKSHPTDLSNMSITHTPSLKDKEIEESRPDAIPVVCTPIGPRYTSISTPLTLTKRTPFHRRRAPPKLNQVNQTPDRTNSDATSALGYDD